MRMIAVLLPLLTFATPAAADAPPNVLVVLSDDHSAPHVGCYGNEDIRTPNLDKFAAEGVRFDRAYVACPQCVPSRASLMTGRSPIAAGMTRFSAALPADVITYPEILRKAGYFTGVAGRTYHLDGAGSASPEIDAVLKKHDLKTFPRRLDFVTQGPDAKALDQFREFLDAVPEGKSFCLQLCFSDPHRPLDEGAIARPHDPKSLTLPAHFPDTPAVREDFARYYDEIARFDGRFGEVLAELDRRKLAGNTIVVFLGDNGASQWRGKGTLYEFGIHVPLLVRWPGVAKPGASADLISGEDLAPTLLEACGATIPKEMTGKSFAPLLRGKAYEPRTHVFAERGPHGSGLPGKSSTFDLGRAVVGKRYKLVYNAMFHLPYEGVDFGNSPMFREVQALAKEGKLEPPLNALYDGRPRPMIEVFDLEDDPAELVNLIDKPEAAQAVAELRAALIEWMTLERDFLPLPITGVVPKSRR